MEPTAPPPISATSVQQRGYRKASIATFMHSREVVTAPPTPRPVTLAVLGTGSRGHTFSSFAQRYPERARVVAVADPRVDRRETLADELGVAADKRFDDWRHVAAQARLADAVIVTTPDREHVGPACRFAELGYHVLLEKPIAPTRAGCIEVIDAVEKAGVILAACHVLRYTTYTHQVKTILGEGRLG